MNSAGGKIPFTAVYIANLKICIPGWKTKKSKKGKTKKT